MDKKTGLCFIVNSDDLLMIDLNLLLIVGKMSHLGSVHKVAHYCRDTVWRHGNFHPDTSCLNLLQNIFWGDSVVSAGFIL